MRRIKVDQDIRSMSEFRNGIAAFMQQVRDTKRPIVITQHGKGAAVLLDVGEYEAMVEQIELLQDIQVSGAQIDNGNGIEHQAAKTMILQDIKA